MRHPDLGKYHRYEVIMKLLTPKQTDGEEKHIEFEVMRMVSFLNKSNIPRKVFESFFRIAKPMSDMDTKTSAVHLFRNLEKHAGARREKSVNNGSSDANELISIHGDILRVLLASMNDDEKNKILLDVVTALLLILDKDNRKAHENNFLYEMKDHVVQVALHCSEHLRPLEGNEKVEVTDYEILLRLSRMNELIGFACSQHPGLRKSNEEDSYYEKAMDYL